MKDLRIGYDDVPHLQPPLRPWLRDFQEPGWSTAAGDHDGPVRLTVPADPRYISLARLCVAGIAAAADARMDEIDDLRMAVTEACQWLLEGAIGGLLEVSVSRTADRIDGSVAAYSEPGPVRVHEPSSLSRVILTSTVDTFEMVVDRSVPRCLFSKRLHTAQ